MRTRTVLSDDLRDFNFQSFFSQSQATEAGKRKETTGQINDIQRQNQRVTEVSHSRIMSYE